MRAGPQPMRRLPLLVGALLLGSLPAAAAELDAPLYASLLERHTRSVADTAGTRVDYRGLSRSAEWRRLVAGLNAIDPDALPGRAARLAFWINAYNILAIDLVVRGQPVESIRQLGWWLRPVWKKPAGTVGGRPVTLDEIEHGILRPMGEPRIHFAIVCASTSCPSLRREPWDAERLDAQLDDAARAFLADRRKGFRLDRARETVFLSRIFDWFAEDFEPPGALAFVVPYLPDAEAAWLAAHPAAGLRYLDYDWSLNDLAGAR